MIIFLISPTRKARGCLLFFFTENSQEVTAGQCQDLHGSEIKAIKLSRFARWTAFNVNSTRILTPILSHPQITPFLPFSSHSAVLWVPHAPFPLFSLQANTSYLKSALRTTARTVWWSTLTRPWYTAPLRYTTYPLFLIIFLIILLLLSILPKTIHTRRFSLNNQHRSYGSRCWMAKRNESCYDGLNLRHRRGVTLWRKTANQAF